MLQEHLKKKTCRNKHLIQLQIISSYKLNEFSLTIAQESDSTVLYIFNHIVTHIRQNNSYINFTVLCFIIYILWYVLVFFLYFGIKLDIACVFFLI